MPLFIVLLLILFFSLPITKNILFAVGSPLWSFKNSFNDFVSKSNDVLKSKNDLIEKNRELEKELKSFEIKSNLIQMLRTENDSLKTILNRKNYNKNGILSAILKKPYLSPYDTLIIDIGSAEGVSQGDKVMADDAISYIGYVSEVYTNESKVVLFSSPGEKVEVMIGKNNILKEAEGIGGGNFVVEVPREFDVEEGDSIKIPSITTNVFGVVEKISFKEVDSYEKVLFKNPVNVSELKWVLVIPKNSK